MRRTRTQLQLTTGETWWIRGTVGAVVILSGFAIWMHTIWMQNPHKAEPVTELGGGDVSVSLGELQAQTPRMFRYHLDGRRTMEVFLSRRADGSVKAGLARCRRCYKFGAVAVGRHVICGRCRNPMPEGEVGKPPRPALDCEQPALRAELVSGRAFIRRETIKAAYHEWFEPLVDGR